MTGLPFSLCLPSPVRQLITDGDSELWLKDDGNVCQAYGGNKPRKLAKLLTAAAERGARRLVTAGAIGSHHLLATAVLGRRAGFATAAVVVPRPHSPHAERTAAQTVGAGMELIPLSRMTSLPKALGVLLRPDGYWIAPGGSSALGALGYLEATLELERQVRNGELPEPDYIVVALGSGGTAAGILAGLSCSSLRSSVVAVPVLNLPFPRWLVESLARRALELHNAGKACQSRQLVVDGRWVGEGYGRTTSSAEEAIETAGAFGLGLESTYTGKAFAAALEWLRGPDARGNVSTRRSRTQLDCAISDCPVSASHRVLFWSTLSAREPETATDNHDSLSPQLLRLFT